MPLVFQAMRELIHMLVRKTQSQLSSLALLNNKATNAKLESVITYLHKLSNVTNKASQTKLATQGSYFYATQARR